MEIPTNQLIYQKTTSKTGHAKNKKKMWGTSVSPNHNASAAWTMYNMKAWQCQKNN